jgi:multicomponent K+:H+ antiporter subunit A
MTLLIAFIFPALIWLGLVLIPRIQRAGGFLLALAALPALIFSLLVRTTEVYSIPWLFFGAEFYLDFTGQVFLLFTSILWLLGGVYAWSDLQKDPARNRFICFYLVAMSGNFGLIVAHDWTSFYVFFTVMTLSAYGLVIHDQSSFSIRAGKVYIAMALLGEVFLLAAFVLLALNPSPSSGLLSNVTVFLILIGFGIKVGAFPFHLWLPLAHPAAPIAASALLSGAMLKAGLLGWLRFLPLGEVSLPLWGVICISAGLVAAFYGILIGMLQKNIKAVLAYSSVSQMGFLTCAIGIGLSDSESWPLVMTAILVYATHHALTKGALFLGVGFSLKAQKRFSQWAFLGLIFCALALAGAPLTSGSVAKALLKRAAVVAPADWPAWFDVFLPLLAIGTTLLMGRFLFLVREALRINGRVSGASEENEVYFGAIFSWSVLLIAVAAVIWFIPVYYAFDVIDVWPPSVDDLWYSTWPLVIAFVLIWSMVWLVPHLKSILAKTPQVPPGDFVIIFEELGRSVSRGISLNLVWARMKGRVIHFWMTQGRVRRFQKALRAVESILVVWRVAMIAFVLLMGVLWLSLH